MSDFDMNKAASTMFPDMAPAAAPAPAPAAKPATETDFERQARVLFGDSEPKPTPTTPAKPVAKPDEPMDDIEKAEKFFKDSPIHETAIRAVESAAIENLSTPEEAAEIAAQYRPMLSAYQLNATEADTLVALGVSATMSPPDAQTIAGWAQAASTALKQDFGRNAGAALNAARVMIAKDSKLTQLLDATGLGSHPQFVRLAAAKAMELKKRGKL